ncbi:methyltransferase domain-containing protein [Phormidium sp. CLA17]|uniref:methyltransferase domain-containing protein n=1 Tax=Leptolyngbya sp. Cla-17 TaxID=2803751 RepID=UPI001490D99A|nr:methyltransferase domain-containing protein [Leptolyngbya sp. Cla-17]MBM0742900.1 methyltransferase domain-containing protein [Leptolyngbya sp. Cla-17]
MTELKENIFVEPTQATAIAYNIEQAVRERYEAGAQQPEALLCCPTDGYDSRYLEILPQEIIEKDYGCGDPTRYVNPGETVVDLGSGAGKNCYILAQRVGAAGQVIGVDFNEEMLALSRKYLKEIGDKLGYRNLEFVKGKIQDLALSLDKMESWLQQNPITTLNGVTAFEAERDRLRSQVPLIASDLVDVVISNCVLNLVQPQDKQQLFAEIFRVLKRGGRAVISDIVCDEDPSPEILSDPKLWSGCIAGAFREHAFLEMFEQAGFHGIEILARQEAPWQIIDGIEFRSMTVRAYKGKQSSRLERNQAVIYKGPWSAVQDDDGHTLYRGQRMAVCDKTFELYTDPHSPYHQDLIPVLPHTAIPLESAPVFDCSRDSLRHPGETKGVNYRDTILDDGSACCSPTASCC